MNPEQIKELAGNTEAIATLLNNLLQPRGINVEVNAIGDSLSILLTSDRSLNQKSLVNLISKELIKIQPDLITNINIYSRLNSESFPDWHENMILELQPKQPSLNELKTAAIQGDIEAIITILTQILSAQNVTIKAKIEEKCLKLILISEENLSKKSTVETIYKQILFLKNIETVEIYTQKEGDEFVLWSQEFNLGDDLELILGNAPPKSNLLKQLRTFQLSSVFPYQDALKSELYQTNEVRLLIFFGFFPWLVTLLSTRVKLQDVAWILGIYYASIWGVVLYNIIKPKNIYWTNIFKCMAFTIFVGIPLLLLFQQVPPFTLLYAATRSTDVIVRIIGFVLGVGLLEEICKALPVYLFLINTDQENHPLNSAFYGAMSGLGFAIAEGVQYSLRYASGLAEGQINIGAYVLINTVRFISLPLIHAIWAGIVGYFLGLAGINQTRKYTIILIGVSISAILHGLYNTFSSGLFGLGLLTFSILLFVTYLRRSQQLVEEMQKAENRLKKFHENQ
jgi:protease PrsW